MPHVDKRPLKSNAAARRGLAKAKADTAKNSVAKPSVRQGKVVGYAYTPTKTPSKTLRMTPMPAGVAIAFVAADPAAEKKLKEWAPVPVARAGQVIDTASSKTFEIDTSAFAPNARARALLQGVKIAQSDLRAAGGAFGLEEVQTLLNGVSRQAVEKRVKEGSLLAVPGPSNRRSYPAVQFDRDGVLPGLKEVQAALPTRNPWAVLNFLVRPDARLGGRSPVEVLRKGAVEEVVGAARRMGEPGG